MCAESKAMIKDNIVSVYMGYNGGNINIKNIKNEDEMNYNENSEESNVTKDEIIKYLSEFEKKELATLLIDLVYNSYEG